jgi:L-lactate dehydrogenase
VEAVRGDEGAVLTVSSASNRIRGPEGISLSVPRVLGNSGIAAELWASLSDEEHEQLCESAQVIRDAVNKLGYEV